MAFAARILSLAPALGGRSPEHLGPGRGPGGGGAKARARAESPARAEGEHVGPRAGRSRGARPDLE